MTARWTTAWVTGASSGIGRELVLQLAKAGVVVVASARSADKLAELSQLSSNIRPLALDVTNGPEVAAAYARILHDVGAIDLAILNAGVWDPMGGEDYGAVRALRSMEVNYGGIAHAVEALLPAMIARKAGQIALVSSVAGYRGLPKAAAYAPSKAAVISLAEVLRLELRRHGITVSLVNPGFVETPMTAVNEFPMPYILKVEDAAARIVRGLDQKRFEIAFPWQLVSFLKFARILPYSLYFRLIESMKSKG